MLTLYGQYRSRAFRVAWLCLESGIPFEHVNVTINVADATSGQDWYRALNPNQSIPTIDDDGLIIWESAAINFHLAEKYGSPLWPENPEARSRMLQWTFFAVTEIEPWMVAVRMHRQVLPEERRNVAVADYAEARLQPRLRVLDDHLKSHAFLGGDRWDMADFMVASICYTFVVMRSDLSAYPAFGAWLAASLDRPKAREARALRE